MMISVTSKSSGKTEAYLSRLKSGDHMSVLNKYGQMGVDALASVTPIDSSRTANSWSYEIVKKRGRITLIFRNSNMAGGSPVAILLQYGHGTGTGGYVQGRDYINPVIRPLFDRIANDVWREVVKDV